MKATLGTLPSDDAAWAYEIKWDGYRTLAFVSGGRVQLQSTNLLDVSAKWPELGELATGVHADRAILDGELVVLDDEGRPRFELVQRHARQAAFYVFDVLSIDGHDTVGLPYEDRRSLLADLVEPGDNWTVPTHRLGDGAELLAATATQGLEGVMAKRLGTAYQPGKRTPNWRKVKNRTRVEVVIGGYTAGTGNRSSTFGALLVGRFDGDTLVFAGGVGTGFKQRTLDELSARLKALRTEDCPFEPEPPREYRRNATWVEPELKAIVEIAEFTNEGYVRHSSFLHLTPSVLSASDEASGNLKQTESGGDGGS
ncbi:MAG: non-homologous end-joining DNA ligase [Ilumatobacteraceae bacterium]